ncbi:MAG: DUF6351 family protein, partial [Candidatus Limnocylindrales bacterium]
MRGFRARAAALAALVIAVAAGTMVPAGAASEQATAAGRHNPNRFEIRVLSGRADQVSGGDALVQVAVPRKVATDDVVVRLGDSDVTDAFSASDGRTLVGLVEGLVNGDNTLTVTAAGGKHRVPRARVTLTSHPIGGPMFSGPQQQPFVCTTARARFDGRSLLGQPLVDNQDRIGIPVAAEDAQGGYPQDGRGYPTTDAQIVGWSKDCAADTRIGYVYGTTGGQFRWLDDPAGPLPADIATVTTLDGQTAPFIVRWERGTINRFIYSVAMLAPPTESEPQDPDDALWNDRLVLS